MRTRARRDPGAQADGSGPSLSAFCPRFHRAVELIGRRWTGAIIRALCKGPLRFNQLLTTVPGLSDRLLSERLRELEHEGLVRRHVQTGPPVRVGYALTGAGVELLPTIRALARWAERHVTTSGKDRRRRAALPAGGSGKDGS